MTQAMAARLSGGLEKLRRGRGLRHQMARGSLWLGVGSGAENAMRIVRNMILARLLAPEAFGAMAIVLAVNGAFEALTEIGIREAVIQNPRGGRRLYLNGAWLLAAARGLALYGVAWLGAPWAAGFYHNPALTPMMRVAFLGIAFNGLVSARAYAALKRLRYRPWVIIQQGGSLIGIATAIGLGLWLRNVWALAIGFAVESAGRCVLSYIVCPFRPGLRLERESLRALGRYAAGMAGLPVLTLLYAKSDVFVLGKLRTAEELGLYSLAASLATIPDTLCSTVLAPVLMPALAALQDEPERLVASLLRLLRLLALAALPVLTLMACGAPLLLRTVYGTPYAAASAAFAVLCAAVAVRLVGWGLVTTFFATGRPELSRWASALRLVVLVAVIVPLVTRLGAAGAAAACLLSGVAWAGLGAFFLWRRYGMKIGALVQALSGGVAVSAAIVGVWLGVKWLVGLIA